MRKLMYTIIAVGLLSVFTACNVKDKMPNMSIQKAELTKEEEQMIELLGVDEAYTIYDFKVDNKAQTMQTKAYELKDGKWEMISGGDSIFKDINGRIALSFENIAMGYRIALQSEDKGGFNSYQAEVSEEEKNMTRATSYLGKREEITYDKEIPLVIQIVTSKNVVSSYDVEYFDRPWEYEKLEYEHVYAITVMFSEKSISELEYANKN